MVVLMRNLLGSVADNRYPIRCDLLASAGRA